jgi:hypothetical protein
LDFYIYLHRKASDGEVFYVGKGCGDRKYDVMDRSHYWKRIVNKHGRTIEIVKDALTEDEAFKLEVELIAHYGRRDQGKGSLCNMTDGGDGAWGQVMSQSARDKVSKARMGNKTWEGRVHSEETKAKMRRPKSEETKAKMRKPKSEEMRKKLSATKSLPMYCSNGMRFGSGRTAMRWLRGNGFPKAAESALTLCCKGKLKTAYGFSWSRDLQ